MSFIWIKLDAPDGAAVEIEYGPVVVINNVPTRIVNVSNLKEAIKRKFAPKLDSFAAPDLKIKNAEGGFYPLSTALSSIPEPAGRSEETPLLVELPPNAGICSFYSTFRIHKMALYLCTMSSY